jgi:hypothetical protein
VAEKHYHPGSTSGITKFQNRIPAAGKVRSIPAGTDSERIDWVQAPG